MTQATPPTLDDAPADVLAVRDDFQPSTPVRVEPVPAPTVETMVLAALQRGASAAELKEMMALFRDHRAEQARIAFNEAMAGFRAECPAILKVKKADFQTKSGGRASYNYAPLEEITKVIDPVLLRHGLTYHWNAKADGKQTTVTCTVSHVEGHSRSSDFTCEAGGSPLMSPAQAAASTITFARRYSLVLALGLTTDEDDDGRRAAPPCPQPEPDPAAPRVGTRAERQQQQAAPPDPNRVTVAELSALMGQWKVRAEKPEGTADEFCAWAAGVLERDDAAALKVTKNWTRDALRMCRDAMA